MQTALSFSTSTFAGTRLAKHVSHTQRPTQRIVCMPVHAVLTKSKPAPAKSSGSKVLVPGKDIKATQFSVGLGRKNAKKVAIGFTKSNELFVGRMAMLGIAFALIGEVLTGAGPLHQLGYEFHESVFDVEGEILGVIALNVIAALFPAKGKFIPDDEELEERPAGALQDPSISILDWKRFFGISGFGFTKENELFVGRVAQLGFAAALLGEALTGKGILGQIGLETGLPLNETEPLILFSILFTALAAITPGSGKFVEDETN